MKIRNVLSVFFLFVLATGIGAQPEPPDQPDDGPGGANYQHESIEMNDYGSGGDQYWILRPAKPEPDSAPLVLFVHGWGGFKPMYYRDWLNHLVKKGNVVVYPRYQASFLTPPEKFTPATINALSKAIERLKKDDNITINTENFGVIGHSAGGTISANVTAIAGDKGLPEPDGVMIIQPGRSLNRDNENIIEERFKLEDLSKIPSETNMIVMVGEDDNVVGNRTARKIFREATSVPLKRRDFIIVRSDRRGNPNLIADHFSPLAMSENDDVKNRIRKIVGRTFMGTNALDYYGYWRLSDALLNYSFHENNRDHALGDTEAQRNMGRWSDGTPVNPLTVNPKNVIQKARSQKGKQKKKEKEKAKKERNVW